jgi:hypothetical protein
MSVKQEENEWKANKIGRRVRNVIADGDMLDRSPESLECSIVSGPRVINTLSSGTDTGGRGGLTWQAHCEFVESF